MAKQRPSSIALNMALFVLLSFTVHFQAQGEGTVTGAWGPTAGGHADTAEFVLLEPIPERLLAATTVGAVNATASGTQQTTDLTCLWCNCCLKNTNPQVCLTTCCYQRVCRGSACSTAGVVSCGCNHCVPPHAHHSRRLSSPPSPRTN